MESTLKGKSLAKYNHIETKKWSKLPSETKILPRGGSALCAYQNDNEKCLYVIGGFSGEEHDDCFKFDLINKCWSEIESIPRKLSVFASTGILKSNNLKARVIMHGGEVDPSTLGHNGAGEFTNETFYFDGFKWHAFSNDKSLNSTKSRGWHNGCADENGNFFIYGGNLENNERSDELWCLSL